jgi:hypothetical protein
VPLFGRLPLYVLAGYGGGLDFKRRDYYALSESTELTRAYKSEAAYGGSKHGQGDSTPPPEPGVRGVGGGETAVGPATNASAASGSTVTATRTGITLCAPAAGAQAKEDRHRRTYN